MAQTSNKSTEDKKGKKSTVLKSKGQILSDYKISLRTFEDLIGRSLVKGSPIARQGKVFIEITPHNDFIFRASANDIFSFKNIRADVPVLPYHRFLCLRFVNTSAQETFDELTSFGIISKTGSVKKSTLTRYYAQFARKCPVEIRRYVETKSEPVKKEDHRLFRLFLDVLGISAYYDSPQCLDEFSFFMEHRGHLEPVMTTISTAEEVADVFGKMTGIPIPVELTAAYRVLFYSTHDMQEPDRHMYFSSFPAKERHLRTAAAESRIQEFVLKQGLDNVYEQRVLLDELQKIAQLSLARASHLKHDAGIQITRSNLDMFLKINDRLDLVSKAGRKDVAKLFDRFIMKPQSNGPIKTINEVDASVPSKEQGKPEPTK